MYGVCMGNEVHETYQEFIDAAKSVPVGSLVPGEGATRPEVAPFDPNRRPDSTKSSSTQRPPNPYADIF